MIRMLAVVLMLMAGGQQVVNTGNHRRVAPACTPPNMQYRWAASAAGNKCNGPNGNANAGGACTTTGDTVGILAGLGNTGSTYLAYQDTTAVRPTYLPAAINGRAAMDWVTANNNYMSLGGPTIPYGTTMTAYFVFKHVSGLGGTVLGAGTGGTLGSVQYFDNGTNVQFNSLNRAIILTGTHTLTTNTWYVSVLTYNFSTGAAALFLCNSGTCISDGTSTATNSYFWEIGVIGGNGQSGYFGLPLAETGFSMDDVTLTSSIGTYTFCQYGI